MAEKLIALRDISDYVKAGDHFEAPDRIFVALGWAMVDEDPPSNPEPGPEPSTEIAPTRRTYRRRSVAS